MSMNEMKRKLRHVGYIVKDMDKSVTMFKKFFDLTDEDIRMMSADDTGGAGAFSFIKVGGTELELIQPLSDFFREMTGDPPAGINHIAFQVQDVEAEVNALEKKGIHLGYITRDGIFDTGKTKIAYLDPNDTDGILIELVEENS
ncbi:MAG: VOC family protein [Proteobacteria bacterium]|nr:VOC family protein [Pseudomonadota bacterium]